MYQSYLLDQDISRFNFSGIPVLSSGFIDHDFDKKYINLYIDNNQSIISNSKPEGYKIYIKNILANISETITFLYTNELPNYIRFSHDSLYENTSNYTVNLSFAYSPSMASQLFHTSTVEQYQPLSIRAFKNYPNIVLNFTPIYNNKIPLTDYTVQYSSDSFTWNDLLNIYDTNTSNIILSSFPIGYVYFFRVIRSNDIGETLKFVFSFEPLNISHGHLSVLRNNLISSGEFPKSIISNGHLSVLRDRDLISSGEFPKAIIANSYLSVLRSDII